MVWPKSPMQPKLTITGSPPEGADGDPSRDVRYTLDRDEAWEIGVIPGARFMVYHEGPLATAIAATIDVDHWNAGTQEATGTVRAGTTPTAWDSGAVGGGGAFEVRDQETGRTYRVGVTAGLVAGDAVTLGFATDLIDLAMPRTFDLRACWWVPCNVPIRWRDTEVQILFDDDEQGTSATFWQHYLQGYIELVPGHCDLWDSSQQWPTFALGARIAGVYTGILDGATGWHLNPLFGGTEDFATAYDSGGGIAGGEAVFRQYPRALIDPRIFLLFSTADPFTPYPLRENGERSAGGYVPGLIGTSGSHVLCPRPEIGFSLQTPTGWVYPP